MCLVAIMLRKIRMTIKQSKIQKEKNDDKEINLLQVSLFSNLKMQTKDNIILNHGFESKLIMTTILKLNEIIKTMMKKQRKHSNTANTPKQEKAVEINEIKVPTITTKTRYSVQNHPPSANSINKIRTSIKSYHCK